MSEPSEDLYPCVGICTTDPDSDYCLGCGRPPERVLPEPETPTPTAVPPADETQPPA